MKIKQEHYDYIKKTMLANSSAPTLQSYLARGLSEKRWRWDMLYAVKLSSWICANIYPYANDDHIDTALRSILRG